MHDLAFADSARPARVVCLRLELLTYSVGHELLLWQTRNPLLLANRDEFNSLPTGQQINALMQAVSICSRTWSENQAPEKWVRLWGWFIRKTDWPVEVAVFRNYLEAGRLLLPTLDAKNTEDSFAYQVANGAELEAGGRALGSPFLAQLTSFLQSHLRVPLAEAWDFSYALAGNLYLAHMENDARLYIENYKESRERAEMAEHIAAIKAEKEAEAAELQPEEI